jgi:replicative DNA helicase
MANNQFLEHSILGTMLNNTSAMIIGLQKINTHEIFSDDVSQLCYKNIQEMFLSQVEVDAFSFKEYLTKKKMFSRVGDVTYKSIFAHNLTMPNFEQKLRSLRDNYIYRVQVQTANDILSKAATGSIPPAELALEAISAIEATLSADKSDSTQAIGSLLFQLNKQMKNPSAKKNYVTTGYSELDEFVKFQEGDLVVLAARPSMGKTALLLEIARRQSFLNNIPVAIFSLEMDAMRYTKRIAARSLKVNSSVFDEDFKDKTIENEYNSLVTKFANSPFYIEDDPSITVNALFAKIIVLAVSKKIRTFAIDHMGLVKLLFDKNKNKTDAIGELTSGLKMLARKLRVTIVVLSQLNRAVEQRPVPRPMLSDLRDSGSIEQDADIVMFLYRTDYYPQTKFEAKSTEKQFEHFNGKYALRHYTEHGELRVVDVSGTCEVIVAKNRDGKTGKLYFDFKKTFGGFYYNESISSLLK